MTIRRLSSDPALGVGADPRLTQVLSNVALVTREIQSRVLSGAGSPENVISAIVGTLYLRTDGGANTTLYVKESGSGNTGWIAK